MNEWIRVCRLEDIPRLGARVVQTAGTDIAVFRAADDAVFAVEDKCPHKGGPLSQGIVIGHKVTCPLHGWIVGLDTGEACAPDQGCTRKLPVRLDGDEVMLGLA